jgi:mono/diheme cytochrome c family protein
VSSRAYAQDGAASFADTCAPCHTIGESGGAGPDLRDVTARRKRDWLIAFVMDPASRNPAATIPAPEGLTRENVATILDYIDTRSSDPSRPPAALANPAFTPDDAVRGQALFAGTARFESGGPACMSCHEAGGGGTFGGGKLGPDLTRVAIRLSGPKATAAWLSAPPTPVMRSLFRGAPLSPGEVRALTAFFVERGKPEAGMTPARTSPFFLFAGAGAAAAFAVIGLVWRGRLRPVRRRLLAASGPNRPGGSR